MTALGDGGAKFIESLVEAAKTLSLVYAASPDERARASLDDYLRRIEPAIIEAVGAGTAKILLEAFASVVMSEKRRIEAHGASKA